MQQLPRLSLLYVKVNLLIISPYGRWTTTWFPAFSCGSGSLIGFTLNCHWLIFVSSSWPLRLVWGLFYDTQSKCSIQTITVSHLREPQGSCWGKDTRKAFLLTHIFILNQTIHFCTPKVLQFASVLRWGGFKLEIGTSSFIISYLSTWPQHRNIE